MKKTFKTLFVLMCGLVVTSCAVDNRDNSAIVVTDDKPFTDDQYIDTSVRPGDDFFRYQYGKWLADAQLPGMGEIVTKKLSEVETEVLTNSDDPAVVAIRRMAKANETDDATDMALLKQRIDYLSAIKTQQDLLEAFVQLHQWGYSPVVRLVTLGSERVIAPMFTSELPSVILDDAFKKENEEMLALYIQSICSLLSKFDFTSERIEEITKNALAVEKIEMQAYDGGFNRVVRPQVPTARTMSRRSASAACRQVCQLLGIGDLADKVLDSTEKEKSEAIGQLMNLLLEGSEESVAQMRDYMIEYVFGLDMVYIPTLTPLPSTLSRMKFAMGHAKYHMFRLQVDAMGAQNIHKERCAEIMEEFRSIFRERIDGLDWMSSPTKQAAQKKIDNMLFFIGCPDQWNDEMTPVVEGNTMLEGVCSLRRQQTAAFHRLIGKSIVTHGWEFWYSFYSFTTYNASYDPSNNQLIITPSFLIAPLFDVTQSEATLYGTASVFGHEMCHGFDAGGSAYNEMGALYDWWTADDKSAFQDKQQQLVALWNQLEQYPGQPADGLFTLRENMADYGGVTLAMEAYSRRLRQQGFTGEQYDAQLKKFWLACGMPVGLSASERSIEALKELLTNDRHSAGHNRINGIARLFDEWYRLYNVTPTDKLYVEPKDRVKIW